MIAQVAHHIIAGNGIIPPRQVVKALPLPEILVVSADHQLGSVLFRSPDHPLNGVQGQRIIRVDKPDIFPLAQRKTGVPCAGNAEILLADHRQPGILLRRFPGHGLGSVFASVIYQDDLQVLPRLVQQAGKKPFQGSCRVVGRYDHTDHGLVLCRDQGLHLLSLSFWFCAILPCFPLFEKRSYCPCFHSEISCAIMIEFISQVENQILKYRQRNGKIWVQHSVTFIIIANRRRFLKSICPKAAVSSPGSGTGPCC